MRKPLTHLANLPVRRGIAALTLALALVPAASLAHPTPFSYVDIRLGERETTMTISGHVVDVAHELAIDNPDVLLREPLPPTAWLLVDLLERRLNLRIDDRPLACDRQIDVRPIASTESIRWSLTCRGTTHTRDLRVDGPMFPYDPEHQTFVSVYREGELVASLVLDADQRTMHASLVAPDSWGNRFIRFVEMGVGHILTGPDHLLFLMGLMLVGGTMRRLALIVTAFTVAHSVTLGLSVAGVLIPSARLIEPLIALSVVYVGLRNLRPATGRDWRPLTAGLFGIIHGFGFAGGLREVGLPRIDLAASVFAFNLGVEAGQLAAVLLLLLLFGALRRLRVPELVIVRTGAIAVATAGAVWFVARVPWTG